VSDLLAQNRKLIPNLVADEKNEAEAEDAMRNEEPVKGGLELDDTSEFVRSVTFDPVAVEPKKLALQLPTPAAAPEPAGKSEDQTIESMEVDDEREDGEADEEDDEAMLNAIEGMIAAAAGGTISGEGAMDAKVEEELDVSNIIPSNILRNLPKTHRWERPLQQTLDAEWQVPSRRSSNKVSCPVPMSRSKNASAHRNKKTHG
jgi:hypothetical protein